MPPALPPIPDVDPAAVRDAAAGLAPLGPAIADDGDRTIRTWRQVGSWYVAPETPVLLAALDPVGPLTLRCADRVGGVARALTAYADQVEPALTELRRLAHGRVTPEQVTRAGALVAEIEAADQECARAIRALAAFDFRPPSYRVGEQVDTARVAVTIGFFTIGQSAVFKETTLSDGTVLLTAVDAGELGVTGTAKVIDLGGGVTLENGSTWRFRNAAEAAALREQLDAYVYQQRALLYDDTGGAAAGVAIFGGVPAPRPPDLVVTEVGATASADGTLPVGVAEGTGHAEFAGKVTTIRDLATGATTVVESREGSASGAVGVTPLVGASHTYGAGGGGTLGSSVAVTRDASGRITRVLLTSTGSAEGSVNAGATTDSDPSGGKHRAPSPTGSVGGEHRAGQVTVTTTALDVTDANRAAVEAWDAAGRPDGGPVVTGDADLHYPATRVPGDPFQNALHDGARVTRATYDESTHAYNLDASIDAGWSLGFEAGAEETVSTAADADYLGPADPDGTRRPVPLTP
jgi:hypothetical protein